jgi:hypothetical protein
MPTLVYPSLTSILPSYYNEEAKEYAGAKTIYQDLGAASRSYADTPVRRWTINYASDGGITETQAAQFVTLADSSKYRAQDGSVLTFNFTPRGESLLSGAQFDEGGFVIRRGAKALIYIVEVKLIKRP